MPWSSLSIVMPSLYSSLEWTDNGAPVASAVTRESVPAGQVEISSVHCNGSVVMSSLSEAWASVALTLNYPLNSYQ